MAYKFAQRKVTEARRMIEALKEFPTPLTGKPGQDKLQAALDAVDAQVAKITALRAKLTEALNDRNQKAFELNETVKRVRANVKGQFGDDSNEYEMVGRTRLSERKRPHLKQ